MKDHPWYTDTWVGVTIAGIGIAGIGIAATAWFLIKAWADEREHGHGA